MGKGNKGFQWIMILTAGMPHKWNETTPKGVEGKQEEAAEVEVILEEEGKLQGGEEGETQEGNLQEWHEEEEEIPELISEKESGEGEDVVEVDSEDEWELYERMDWEDQMDDALEQSIWEEHMHSTIYDIEDDWLAKRNHPKKYRNNLKAKLQHKQVHGVPLKARKYVNACRYSKATRGREFKAREPSEQPVSFKTSTFIPLISSRPNPQPSHNYIPRVVQPYHPTPVRPYQRKQTSRYQTGRDADLERAIFESTREYLAAQSQVPQDALLQLLSRDITPEDYDLLLRLDETVASKTLNQETVNKLKREAVEEKDCAIDCTICLLEYELGENKITLPCGHFFHSKCIEKWLTESSVNCPVDNLPVQT